MQNQRDTERDTQREATYIHWAEQVLAEQLRQQHTVVSAVLGRTELLDLQVADRLFVLLGL